MMMKQSLEHLVKQDIGYVDRSKECKDCTFYKEVGTSENWKTVCNLHESTVGQMPVASEGYCRFYSAKKQ